MKTKEAIKTLVKEKLKDLDKNELLLIKKAIKTRKKKKKAIK